MNNPKQITKILCIYKIYFCLSPSDLTVLQTSPCFQVPTNLLKTLREKEKLLVTSNFSFSHSVFYPLGKLSTILIKSKIVVCKFYESFENTVGKGEMLVTSSFSFSHSVFYPLGKLSIILIKFKIVVCKFFEFGRV